METLPLHSGSHCQVSSTPCAKAFRWGWGCKRNIRGANCYGFEGVKQGIAIWVFWSDHLIFHGKNLSHWWRCVSIRDDVTNETKNDDLRVPFIVYMVFLERWCSLCLSSHSRASVFCTAANAWPIPCKYSYLRHIHGCNYLGNLNMLL